MEKIEDLLDESITAKGYVIREPMTSYKRVKATFRKKSSAHFTNV
jgi:hypothetical protein